MKPSEVFDKLLDLMSQDNGFKFSPTPAQRERAEVEIAVLQLMGWQPDKLSPDLPGAKNYGYADDFEVLGLGDEEGQMALIAKWGPAMGSVNAVLNAVFDQ